MKKKIQKTEVKKPKSDVRRPRMEAGKQGNGRFLLISTALFLVVVGLLTVAAYARNSIYRSHVTLWAEIVKSSPNKRRAHENYGQALSTAASHATLSSDRDRYLAAALREFKTVMALPDDGSVPLRDLYREVGVVHYRLAQYDDAVAAWQQGLTAAPYDPSLLNNLSIVMLQKGRYDDAARYAEMALMGAPSMPQALNTMGQVYLLKKNYEKASQYFIKAIEQEPDVPQRYWNAALALEQAGRYDMAFQYANRYAAMAADPAARQQAYGYLEHLKKIMGR
jgi:tetratricopeptide (TPR) repeat protein